MKRFIEGEERGQGTLFPDRLDDWIGEDNPVRVVDIFVEELDSGDLGFDRIAPRATGWPGYHPSVLLKLYIYGYLTHVIFQDLDWVPANHAQAEDRCYRLGQDKRVTVEYFHAAGTLDGYIAELLQQKMALIAAVEAEDVPDTSLLADIQDGLRRLAPALMEEARAARATGDAASRLDQLSKAVPRATPTDAPLLETGVWEFTSSRDPSAAYQVTFGRAGHLECSCPGFNWRGNCKHVREVREKVFEV